MFSIKFGKRPMVEESQAINAAICIRNYLLQRQVSIIRRPLNLNIEADVQELISEIESGVTLNLSQQNGDKIEYTDQNRVKVTYTKSNLKRGYVFWFLCNICSRRVKYLYFPSHSTTLACRNCHRLSYYSQHSQSLNSVITKRRKLGIV